MKHIKTVEIHPKEINWEKTKEYFKGYTHIDVEDIPENYEDYVLPMRDVILQEGIISMKYGQADILSREKNKIILENGISFSGKMIAKAYEHAEKIILYVISVTNMDELMAKHPDPMDSFFLDYWTVSVLNSIREQYYDIFMEEFLDTDHQLTYVWSPGQSQFELENQLPLFQLLKPETMGVILDQYMRMVPFKSVSGTVGIVSSEIQDLLISCDLCSFAKQCPGYKGKKYAEIGMEERRL